MDSTRRFYPAPLKHRFGYSLAWLSLAFGASLIVLQVLSSLTGDPIPGFAALFGYRPYFWGALLVLSGYVAQLIIRGKRVREGRLYEVVKDLARELKMPMPRVLLSNDSDPQAIASGPAPWFATVGATQGLLDKMSDRELRAVMAHEMSHVRYWHVPTAMVSLAALCMLPLFSKMFFSPVGYPVLWMAIVILGFLAWILITEALTRSNEYMADEGAALATDDPEALRTALHKLAYGGKKTRGERGIVQNLIATHPSIPDRDHRLGRMRVRK